MAFSVKGSSAGTASARLGLLVSSMCFLCSLITLYLVASVRFQTATGDSYGTISKTNIDQPGISLAPLQSDVTRILLELRKLREDPPFAPLASKAEVSDALISELASRVVSELRNTAAGPSPALDMQPEATSVAPERRRVLLEMAGQPSKVITQKHFMMSMNEVLMRYGGPDIVAIAEGNPQWTYTIGSYSVVITFSGSRAMTTDYYKIN